MKTLLSVADAQARLFALKAPLPAENIILSQSIGRFLSDVVIAKRDQPAEALSAMDGFAIRYADLPGPWTLTGAVAAGAVPLRKLEQGEAIRIFTGAMLPEGADTILVQEDAEMHGDQVVLTGEGPPNAGRHIRKRGSDFDAGDRLIESGTKLTAGALAAAAMGGTGELKVGTRPRVAIISTGDELVPPGNNLASGQIPDSNGVMLAALLAAEPALVTPPQHVRDNRQALSCVLDELARRHDVIVTIGGVSVGAHDHVQNAIDDAGGAVDFWKVAMRPGKPVLAATLHEAVVLGLPGNPSSSFVTAHLFLLPLVRHLAGAGAPLPEIHIAALADPLAAGKSRREYLRAVLTDGQLTPLTSQDSGQTRPLVAANALIVHDVGAEARSAGDLVSYISL